MNHSASINTGRTMRQSFNVSHSNFVCLPLKKHFQKYRQVCKQSTTFWFVPLEIFRRKKNFSEGSPVFPPETFRWKYYCFASLTSSRPLTSFSQLDAFRFFLSVKMACAYSSEDSVQSLYECSVSPFLAFYFQSLLLHYCGTCLDGRQNLQLTRRALRASVSGVKTKLRLMSYRICRQRTFIMPLVSVQVAPHESSNR